MQSRANGLTPPASVLKRLNWPLLATLLFLAGCGGGGGGGTGFQSAPAAPAIPQDPIAPQEPATSPSESQGNAPVLSGVAMKGRIQGGIVNAYGIESLAGHFRLGTTPLAGPTRTSAEGRYRLELTLSALEPSNSADSPLVIELTADDLTTMVCDLPSGCTSEEGELLAFGDPMSLPPGFRLYAALPRIGSGEINVHLTPLTHMAYRWAEQQPDGLNPDNIRAGHQKFSELFDLPQDLLALRPLDISQIQGELARQELDQAALEYALLSAAFLSLADQGPERNLNQVLESSAQAFAAAAMQPVGGKLLDSEDIKTRLNRSAASIARSLSEELQSSPPPSGPGSVSKLVAQLEAIGMKRAPQADSDRPVQEVLEAPRITYYPFSRQLRLREEVTLNINANGSSPLGYQWRKNGVPIEGARGQHFTIAAFTQEHEGSYDCIVSNAAGSVVSPAATLTLARGALTLAWTAPSQRQDGTPLALSDIQGYQLLYGTMRDQLDQHIEIEGGHNTQYRFEHLPSDTYHFGIIAIDRAGLASPLSEVIDVQL